MKKWLKTHWPETLFLCLLCGFVASWAAFGWQATFPPFMLAAVAIVTTCMWLISRDMLRREETDGQRRKRLKKAAHDMDREIERLKREQNEKSAARVRVAEELAILEPKRDYRVSDPPDEEDEEAEPKPARFVDKNRA